MSGPQQRVLVVQPACPDYRRAFFELLARQLNVLLICSEVSIDGAKSDVAGINCPVELVETTAFGRMAAWQKNVVRRLLRDPPEVLVVNGNPRYLSTLVALVVARIKGIKIVWWGHAMSSTSRPLRAWLRKQLMRLAHRVFLYYPEEVPLLPAVLRKRAVGIDNSVDTEKCLAVSDTLTKHQIENFKTGLGLGTEKMVLTIGRLTKKARVDLVLRALAELRAVDNIRLAILGGGEELDDLKKTAARLGVMDNVFFVGPVFDEAQIGLWMRSSDLFVYGGAVGLSLVHAFCYALPAVISSPASGHMPEALLFRDGEHGMSFKGGEPSFLAEAMQTLLNDTNRTSMGLAAQNLVRHRLSAKKMAQNFIRGLQD
ncbi:MAG: glycosyltransferase [Gammaproteobacteria bacterium]|nr:glycosyltransferase [Gammaproteobacteria bacterium]MDH3767169.1 glycosyltransferase [Gammaproteobacteria bacterium]